MWLEIGFWGCHSLKNVVESKKTINIVFDNCFGSTILKCCQFTLALGSTGLKRMGKNGYYYYETVRELLLRGENTEYRIER